MSVCSVPDEGGCGYDDKEEGLLSSEDKGSSLEVWHGGGAGTRGIKIGLRGGKRGEGGRCTRGGDCGIGGSGVTVPPPRQSAILVPSSNPHPDTILFC